MEPSEVESGNAEQHMCPTEHADQAGVLGDDDHDGRGSQGDAHLDRASAFDLYGRGWHEIADRHHVPALRQLSEHILESHRNLHVGQ